ncbi:hypothetical protein [Nocardia sp. NPDC058497]|uniref:hypothetical protein n=1 Tax=Nocardia sp. NPDC058497 TaxID=3346529 RepID=UPI0036643FEF
MSTENLTHVYDEDVMITMRGVADSVGLPYTVNPVELVDREVLIELREGPAGPVGPECDAAWPWQWQGDIDDAAALTALALSTDDARKAWRVVAENAVYYWTGLEFIAFEDAFQRPGRRGKDNALSGSAVAGAVGSSASARVIGIAPGQQVEITFPRGAVGAQGDPGEAGRIQDAVDVQIDDDRPLGQDHVLAWDATVQKFRPIPTPRPRGPWVIGEKQFFSGKNVKEQRKVLASITIPAQPTAWRPLVEGAVVVQSAAPTRCDVLVRVGGVDGDVVGYGWGHSVTRVAHVPITPGCGFAFPEQSTPLFGVVPANQTVTLYVVVDRVTGSGTYNVYNNYSHLQVRAIPLVG